MERFGRYVLLERIATGGMAEVFRAAAVGAAGFSRFLAVKRVLPHLSAEHEFTKMLIDEARIAAGLSHPNILQVQDLGEEGGRYFLAMEYVAGQTLAQVVAGAIKSGRTIPQPICAYIIAHALQGLAYAHQKVDTLGRPMGIIHRDVSPQNIMVSFDGSVRLADFGIAKAAERSTHTQTGTLRGKPGYMSPEQVQGAYDQRADIYAMGVVFHELLTMRRMRVASNDMQMLMKVVSGKVPRLEEMGVELPQPLADVLYRSLEPTPEQRYQNASEFLAGLESAMRLMGWAVTPVQCAQLMQELFPSEIQREHEAQLHYGQLLVALSQARTRDVSALIARASQDTDPQSGDDGNALLVARRRKSKAPVVAAASVVIAGLGFAWASTRGTPAPPPMTATALPASDDTPAPPPPAPVREEPPAKKDKRETRTAPRKAEGGGKLTLQSHPWGRIFVDGKDTGRFTPVDGMPIAAGKHTIRLVNDEMGVSATVSVDVKPGADISLARELK